MGATRLDAIDTAGPLPVVALFGPTGVGKTEVAVELADLLRARGEDPVAVSADALQVYEGLGTLTGQPSEVQRRRLEHRLQRFVPVTRTFSVGEFMPRAHDEIDRALAAGRRPLVVGGTGLYLRAAIAELDLRPPPPPALRARLEESLRGHGPAALHAQLRERSPAAAERIDPGDSSRLVRALELLEMDEDPTEPEDGSSQLWTDATRHPTLLVGLVMEREALYRRIDARVEAMVAGGAAEEVRRAEAAGASPTARKALGFEELLRGDVGAMKRRTRNYARRQLTWMRKLAGVARLDVTGRAPVDVAAEVAKMAVSGRAPGPQAWRR
jgi:tRNA dimethylallyltransferase